MIRSAGLLLCLLSLGACSSVGTYVPPAEGLPAAVVIGADSTIPQGTDLTEAYFLVSNYGMNISPMENGTASGL